MTNVTAAAAKRGRPKGTARNHIERSVKAIDAEFAKILKLFEGENAGVITAAERVALFGHLQASLDLVSSRSERAHVTATLSSSTFSLAGAAAQMKADDPGPRGHEKMLPVVAVQSPARVYPEGYIMPANRNPALVYDEETGRAVGRKSKSAPDPVGVEPGMSFSTPEGD